jgi:hypothetical protein
MRDNDAVIGSMFFALEMILRKATWTIEPAAGSGSEGDDYADFLKSCMDDMSHTFEDFISECVSMFVFGFALFETVYKRRQGPDGKTASAFDDGLIGWRKLAPRAQETILYWIWDEEGGLQGAVQLAAPDYRTVSIPIEKLLLFRTTSSKNSPEGRSVLRNCYRPWCFKRRIEEIEAIGTERDLCGIPVLYTSKEAMDAMGGEAAARKLVTGIRVDDQAGVILPIAYDTNGNPLVKLELLKSAGSKQMDTTAIIERYNRDLRNSIMCGFLEFGQTPTGSRSLHQSATQIFFQTIRAFMDSVAGVFNRIAVRRLLSLNHMDLKKSPLLKPGEIGVRDLDELASFIAKCSAAGLTFFDEPTENYIRAAAGLPNRPKDDEDGPLLPAPRRAPQAKETPQAGSASESDQEAQEQLEGVA